MLINIYKGWKGEDNGYESESELKWGNRDWFKRDIFCVAWGNTYSCTTFVAVACAVAVLLIIKICITPLYTSTTKLYVLSKTSSDISY